MRALHEPRSAVVPAASCGGVSPPARTPAGTPGELAGEDAGEDACATSAGQFMVPMHAKKRKGALHEPPGESTRPTGCRPGPLTRRVERFMVPMHSEKRKEALHEPTHPRPISEGSRRSSAPRQFPSWEGLGVGSWSQCTASKSWGLSMNLRFVLVVVLVLVLDPMARFRGRGRAGGRSGSWSRCMRKSERRLSMNRPVRAPGLQDVGRVP